MASNIKITKEKIIDIAYEITRKEGLENLNVRKIANKLEASVQPIYYQFQNFEELKKQVLTRIIDTYHRYMKDNLENNPHAYKQIGLNYIRFAQEEPKLFQIIFMTKTMMTPQIMMKSDPEIFEKIIQYGSPSTGLSKMKMAEYHQKMWVFTHGIACLMAMQTCNFTSDEINKMLSDEFIALNLLEKERKENEKSN